MATYSSVFPPATAIPTKVSALSTGTAIATALSFPKSRIIAIQPVCAAAATSPYVQIKFGNASNMTAAANTGWPVFCGTVAEFDMSDQWTFLSVFNASSGNADIYVYELFRS
jgi:hypothetical protein